ncbi:MAG: hypothetical protein K6T29_02465 [Peptococcaceae bacterium]|nr:hypothetical protein [Peptococcaceae bacterium]
MKQEAKAEREHGRAELEALRQTVLYWKEDYRQWGCEAAAADFMDEIDGIIYPYLKRLLECDFIDEVQFRQFLSFCDEQMGEIGKSEREVS